jgi:hypothetical protein
MIQPEEYLRDRVAAGSREINHHAAPQVTPSVRQFIANEAGSAAFLLAGTVLALLTGGSVDADIQPQVTYSHAAVTRLVGRVKRTVDRPARDASVSYTAAGLGTVPAQNGRTLEDLVKEMLRPQLKTWLDDNLPGMVERLVRAEIERVSRGR